VTGMTAGSEFAPPVVLAAEREAAVLSRAQQRLVVPKQRIAPSYSTPGWAPHIQNVISPTHVYMCAIEVWDDFPYIIGNMVFSHRQPWRAPPHETFG